MLSSLAELKLLSSVRNDALYFCHLIGATEEEFTLCKDGFALKADDNLIVTIKNDICSLKIQSLTLADKATYSVKRLNADIHEGQIFVKVSVDKSK